MDVLNEVKARLGMRDSLRLFAAADIVAAFESLGEFSRAEVIRTFSDVYGTKCLDRAMADLEAGSVLSVVQACKQDVSAGSSYRISPRPLWSTRDPQSLVARKLRHGRGGCRGTLPA